MKRIFKESGHLARMVALLGMGLAAFLLVRAAIVPKSFGQYGHYRGAALAEIMARPGSFAGKATCEACHADIAETKNKGKHAGVSCEACHGPSAAHAENPGGSAAVKPDPAALCVRCHEANPSKPKWFPQVSSKEHAAGVSCGVCHQPHSPAI
ncbi:MAG: multiheme c-type cytochrome [Bryobacteraceae bacterium]